jgi:hypothetical protein
MFGQQFRGLETILAGEVVGQHRLAGMQRVARRRVQLRPDRDLADHAIVPADPGAHQEPVLIRQILQHLAEPHVHPERGDPGAFRQQIVERNVAHGPPAELRQQRLLRQPRLQFAVTDRCVRMAAHRTPPLVS